MVTSGTTWETVAVEATSAAALVPMRLLSFTNLPAYVASGDYHVLLEWPGGFAQFHVPNGSNIFAQLPDPYIAVDEVISSSPSVLNSGSHAVFCHVCTTSGSGTSTNIGGPALDNTCWALTPTDDKNRNFGCNGPAWAGQGLYYAGYGQAGAFVGPKNSAENKGTDSLGLTIKVRRSTGLSRIAAFSSASQKVCTNSAGATIHLDLAGDGQNGLNTDFVGCEAACRRFAGCKYFLTDPGAAAADWCVGYPSCEFQKAASLGRAVSIFKVESLTGRVPSTQTSLELSLSSAGGSKLTFGDVPGRCATTSAGNVLQSSVSLGLGMALAECIQAGRTLHQFITHWSSNGKCVGMEFCPHKYTVTAADDQYARTYSIAGYTSADCWEADHVGTCLGGNCAYPPGGNNDVPSIHACQQYCQAETSCTWFSYSHADNYCVLYSAKGAKTSPESWAKRVGPRYCPGTDSNVSPDDVRVFMTSENGTAPVAAVSAVFPKVKVSLSNLTDHNVGNLEAQVVYKGVLSNKATLAVVTPVRPQVFRGCTAVSAGALSMCDSDADGVFEDPCVLNALCLPWAGVNGGCGTTGKCEGRDAAR